MSGLRADGTVRGDGKEDLESIRFSRCITDLEDEMSRALGPGTVEEIVAAEGEPARSLALALDLNNLPAPLAGLLGQL